MRFRALKMLALIGAISLAGSAGATPASGVTRYETPRNSHIPSSAIGSDLQALSQAGTYPVRARACENGC